jgi:hypothetical protein
MMDVKERTGQLGNYAQPGVRDPVNHSHATLMDCGIWILAAVSDE